MLFNLLDNAVKFTATGRIELRARATSDLAYLAFEVEDTGIGIPRELQSVIFERFVQGDSGTKQRFGGCGLGLALARALVLSMGGGIGVTSAPGAGALFRVALPLSVKPNFGWKAGHPIRAPHSTAEQRSCERARSTKISSSAIGSVPKPDSASARRNVS